MTTISHLRACQPRTLLDVAEDLTTQANTLSAQLQQMDRDIDTAMNHWQGDAASAALARSLSQKLAGNHIAAAMLTLADHLDNASPVLDGFRDAVLKIVDIEAPAAGMTVTDDGTVTAPKMPNADSDIVHHILQNHLDDEAASLQYRIKTLLVHFEDTENTTATTLTEDLTTLESYVHTPEGPPDGDLVKAIIDGHAPMPTDPTALHAFWQTLTPAEKDDLWHHDHTLGNHDGLPAVDRDHYNRMHLNDELAHATQTDPTANNRIGDLRTVSAALNQGSDRMLLLLDDHSNLTHAAVAVGNPDTATHIGVTTPGLNTTVSGAFAPGAMADQAAKIKDEAESDLLRVGRSTENVSMIAWMGYDTPQLHVGSPDTAIGAYTVATDDDARVGAKNLAHFYDGLAASNTAGSPHLVAIGHSYGSLTAGLALQEPGGHPVQDLVVYGSPGLDTGYDMFDSPLPALHLQPGHAYEMTAHDDPIANLNSFGLSPGYTPGFTHLGTDATTTPDGVTRSGATGHSQYPTLDNRGVLRTSGYNIATVVAGLPDVVIGEPGYEKAGEDFLRWLAGGP